MNKQNKFEKISKFIHAILFFSILISRAVNNWNCVKSSPPPQPKRKHAKNFHNLLQDMSTLKAFSTFATHIVCSTFSSHFPFSPSFFFEHLFLFFFFLLPSHYTLYSPFLQCKRVFLRYTYVERFSAASW